MRTQAEKTSSSKYVVNQAIGNSPGVGWIPINQFVSWLLIGIGVWLGGTILANTPLQFSVTSGIFIWLSLCLAYWALTGKKEHQYLDSYRALGWMQTVWVRAKVALLWTKAGLPKKEKVGKMGSLWSKLVDKQAEVLEAIEDKCDLVCYGRIELQGYKVGFYLLEGRKGQYKFIFRWQAKGLHPTIGEEDAEETLEYWEKGVEGLPPGEEVLVEQSSFTSDEDRQQELDSLLANENQLAQALVYSQKTRTRQITKKGLRKVKTTMITASFTPGLAQGEDKDIISRLVKALWQSGDKLWETFSGEKEMMNHQRLHKLVNNAFTQGFLRYHSTFTTVMRLEARPMTDRENWQADYKEHHQGADYTLNKREPIPLSSVGCESSYPLGKGRIRK